MCEPMVPPNEKSNFWRKVLMGLAIIQLCLAIMLCFVDMYSGMYELIDVMILCCALARIDYCCLTMYIVYISLNMFPYISMIGLCIQNQEFVSTFETGSSSVSFWFTTICLLTIYYMVAIVVCFFAYREFKGLLWWDNGIVIGAFGCPGIGRSQ